MAEKSLSFYLKAFEKLRRDNKMGGAPHKPILLLSLIDQFQNHEILNNKIFITPELIAGFKTNWSKFVESDHTMSFALPFFHMRSEPFWKLVPNEGCEIWVESQAAMRQIGNLQRAIHHAEIDPELFMFLQKPESRELLRHSLMTQYFPKKVGLGNDGKSGLELVKNIENEILNQSSVEYQKHLSELKNSLAEEAFYEEIAIRGGLFKRKIPMIYGFECCVSGFKITTNFNTATLIEACHIKPFSISFDDTLSNGIALCPTLHKAFDAGIFTIDSDFKVVVSGEISENDSPQSLKRFHGRKIKLPLSENHFPNRDSLEWHREQIFQKGR